MNEKELCRSQIDYLTTQKQLKRRSEAIPQIFILHYSIFILVRIRLMFCGIVESWQTLPEKRKTDVRDLQIAGKSHKIFQA